MNLKNLMGYQISALITQTPIDLAAVESFDLPVFIECDYAIVPLDPAHNDYWHERIGIVDTVGSKISLDTAFTHYIAERIGAIRYAVIETDYHGGSGSQIAAVYENERLIMPATCGGINSALKLIGVRSAAGSDEFDTINLGKYRDFSDYFRRYYDDNV